MTAITAMIAAASSAPAIIILRRRPLGNQAMRLPWRGTATVNDLSRWKAVATFTNGPSPPASACRYLFADILPTQDVRATSRSRARVDQLSRRKPHLLSAAPEGAAGAYDAARGGRPCR